MAVSDPIEWFGRFDSHITYGIAEDKETGEWVVVKKEFADALGDSMLKVSPIARVPTRAGAIGILKLIRE